MPDIVHVISDMSVGGAGVLLSHLLTDAPNEAGSLVLLPKGSLLCSLLEERRVPFLPFSAKKERSFSVEDTRTLARILSGTGARLVVSHASLSARLAAKSRGLPTVSVRHCDTAVRRATSPLYNRLTDATIATSRPLGAHLMAAGIKGVRVIENGYTPMGCPTRAQRRAAKRMLSIPESRIAIGLAGRLSPVKGQETAIRALALLGEARKTFLLLFLGVGEEAGRLSLLARTLGVEKEVRFLGFLADVRPFYHAIDAHISCSLDSETSSLSLAEGMSAGCPTVASDTCGNRARVGGGGLLFPCGDAEALSRLFLLLSEEKKREHLSRLAVARANELPTWERVRREYGALFGSFCGEVCTNG